MIKKFEYKIILYGAFLLMLITTFLNFYCDWLNPVIRSDGEGYYAYLPAAILDRDLSMQKLADRAYNGAMPVYTGITRSTETGRYVDRYPIGVAVMGAPFFGVATVYAKISGQEAGGYSAPYQFFMGFAGTIYTILGILILVKFLKMFFEEKIVLATVIIILFSTNLFHYATFDSMFSHSYSFFLFAAFLFLIHKFFDKPRYRYALLLGIVSGLLFLVRNTNIILALVFLLYGVTSKEKLKQQIQFFWKEKKRIGIILLTSFVIALPQFIYWKYAGGSWFLNSYAGYDFNFFQPKVLEVLFSTQKGLFFWTPLLLFIIPGFIVIYKEKSLRSLFFPVTLYLLIQLYIVASWFDWQYGSSFGHRAFVESLVFMSILIAGTFSAIRNQKLKIFVAIFCLFMIAINCVQMIQYGKAIIPYENTTWEKYTQNFLKFT